MAASSRDLLTPDALSMLLAIEETGSFAAAARQRGLVPSALTYRIRQIEDALDVLLFDRSSHFGMQVTGVQHGDAAREIDVATALDIPDLGVASPIRIHLQGVAETSRNGGSATLSKIGVSGHSVIARGHG